MASSDSKRRGGGSSTHTLRSGTSSRSSSIIAPPPRAQLGGPASSSSSPGVDNDNASLHSAHDTASIISVGGASIKDGGGGGGGGGGSSSSATAALAAKERECKEKDELILELKREVTIMESEFARQVDRLSQNESETAVFWQSKHSNLNQQFLRTDTELRLLRAELDVREAEREELRDGYEILRRELKDREDEIRALRAQNRGLKEWVSNATRTDDQTSDEVFADGMARLGNGLQNWVIVHFRRAKLDLSTSSGSVINELAELVPMYEELAGTAKVHLLQSIVSTVLVDVIFSSYFVGLSKEQASHFRQMETFLSNLESDEAVNQWRAMTLATIKKDSSEKLLAEATALTEDVISTVNRILGSITDAAPNSARDQALRVLVGNSIDLSRLLAVQKAIFKVAMPRVLPHQRTMFDASEMEDIGGEDEESLTAREICCVTFPNVTKSGDEHGSHTQFRNVIAKARVLCAPE